MAITVSRKRQTKLPLIYAHNRGLGRVAHRELPLIECHHMPLVRVNGKLDGIDDIRRFAMSRRPPVDDEDRVDREELPRGQGRSQQPATEIDPGDVAPGKDPEDVSGFPGEVESGGAGTGSHIFPGDFESEAKEE